MTAQFVITFRNVRSGSGHLVTGLGENVVDCEIADIAGVPGNLLWSALTALHYPRVWQFTADDEPGYWSFAFEPFGLENLVLWIDHCENEELPAVHKAKIVVGAETFACAVMEEMKKWRDVVGLEQFESQFFETFPNRMMAALVSALAERPRKQEPQA